MEGSADLGRWLHTEINIQHQELNPDTVTHPSTNYARCRLTFIDRDQRATATLDHQIHFLARGYKRQLSQG